MYAQVPPRVDYELTELGHSLGGPIAALTDWAERHVSGILAAREEFEAGSASPRIAAGVGNDWGVGIVDR